MHGCGGKGERRVYKTINSSPPGSMESIMETGLDMARSTWPILMDNEKM